MKKIIDISGVPFLIICMNFLFILHSCNKDSFDNSSKLNGINIIGDHDSVATKTTLNGLVTSWVSSSDKVGVYCAEADISGGRVNIPYTASSSASQSAFTGDMTWGTGSHNFYSYYPYVSGSSSATVVPISLSASQTQNGGSNNSHISSLDFMVSIPRTNVTPGTPENPVSVNLTYKHVFSILEFKFYSPTGSGKITKLRLTAPSGNLSLTSGTIDITQAEPASGVAYTIASAVGSSEITLSITGGATVGTESGNTSSIYMMILPGDFSSQNLTIGLEFDNQGFFTNYNKAGKSFLRGKRYVVTMNLDDSNPWGSLEPVTINHTITTAVSGVSPATGNITWAPVNSGYDNTHLYGLLYQWGRKYGQASRSSESPASNLIVGQVTISTGNLVANSNNFYADPKIWCSDAASPPVWDLTLYNPCPPGWTIPTRPQVAALHNIERSWSDSEALFGNIPGRWFGVSSNQVFLPGGGDRLEDGSYFENGIHSDIWTNSSPIGSSGKAYCYDNYKPGSSKPTVFDSDYIARGNSVRCVKK